MTTAGAEAVPSRDEAAPTPSVSRSVIGSKSRAGLSIGIALGLHSVVALAHVTSHSAPCLGRVVAQADLVEVEAVQEPEAAEPPPPPPPPVRPETRREHTQVLEEQAQPVANPETGTVVPDEAPTTPPATVATTSEQGLQVAAIVGEGSGGSGQATRHEGPPSEGATNGPATPAYDPRPAQRAYRTALIRLVGRPAYTNSMRRHQVEGSVLIGITVDPEGHVSGLRVKRSSGNDEIDENALEHVRDFLRSRSNRVTAPPTDTLWETREVALPFEYDFAED